MYKWQYMINNNIKNIWNYRNFIIANVKRDFQIKYQKSLLGAFWAVINPFCMIILYSVIFAGVMEAKIYGLNGDNKYIIYLCTGILTWTLFSEIISGCLNVFVINSNIIKKIKFPHLALPMSIVISSVLNFIIVFSIFLLFLLFNKVVIGVIYFAIIPILVIQVIFSFSIGIILGALNVFFRDMAQAFQFIIQIWFWLTPVVYTIEIIPSKLAKYISLNPITPLMNAYRDILVRNTLPAWEGLLPMVYLTTTLLVLGLIVFSKIDAEMIDEL